VFTNPAGGGGGPWLHGDGRLQAISCSLSGPLGLDGSGAAFDAASCHLVGAWLPNHHTGDSRAVRGFATSMASPARRAHWGTVQDVVRRGGGGGVLGWSLLGLAFRCKMIQRGGGVSTQTGFLHEMAIALLI
jgi:hypothetical protein